MPEDHLTTSKRADDLWQLAFGFMHNRALHTAFEIKIFDLIESKDHTSESLVLEMGMNKDFGKSFVTFLIRGGYLTTSRYNHLRITAEYRPYLSRNSDLYMGDLFIFASERYYTVWNRFKNALFSGMPESEAKNNPDLFAGMYKNANQVHVFAGGMAAISALVLSEINERQLIDWNQLDNVVDLGGASGEFLFRLLRSNPSMTALCLDLPQMANEFEIRHQRFYADIQGRAKFKVADMFRDALPSASAYILGQVLHDWGPAKRSEIIRHVFGALRPNGLLLIYDSMVSSKSEQESFGFSEATRELQNLHMMMVTGQGGAYSPDEVCAELRRCGFNIIQFATLFAPMSAIVARKLS